MHPTLIANPINRMTSPQKKGKGKNPNKFVQVKIILAFHLYNRMHFMVK